MATTQVTREANMQLEGDKEYKEDDQPAKTPKDIWSQLGSLSEAEEHENDRNKRDPCDQQTPAGKMPPSQNMNNHDMKHTSTSTRHLEP